VRTRGHGIGTSGTKAREGRTEASLLLPSVTFSTGPCVFHNAGSVSVSYGRWGALKSPSVRATHGSVSSLPQAPRSAADAVPTSAGPGRDGIRGTRTATDPCPLAPGAVGSTT